MKAAERRGWENGGKRAGDRQGGGSGGKREKWSKGKSRASRHMIGVTRTRDKVRSKVLRKNTY